VANPQLTKYRGRLVTVRAPGLRGKRTGWVIDEDDEGYDWRDDLGDAEERVEAGELVPVVYLGEVDDGELVEGEGFLLFEPKSQDVYLVEEGSLDEDPKGSLEEIVVSPLAGQDEEDDEDDDDYESDVDDEVAPVGGDDGDGDGEADEEYKEGGDEEDE
jgi:hypothetical protein